MRYLEYEGNEKLELPFQEEYLLLTEERLKSGDLNCAMGFRLHVFVDEKVLEKTINKIIELNDAFVCRLFMKTVNIIKGVLKNISLNLM